MSPLTQTHKGLYQPVTPSTDLPRAKRLQPYEPCLLLLLVFPWLPVSGFRHMRWAPFSLWHPPQGLPHSHHPAPVLAPFISLLLLNHKLLSPFLNKPSLKPTEGTLCTLSPTTSQREHLVQAHLALNPSLNATCSFLCLLQHHSNFVNSNPRVEKPPFF